jgi:hypothetical protein
MRTSASTTLDAPASVRRGACTRSIGADAHGEHRNATRAQGEQRIIECAVAVVGAIGDDNDTGQRHPVQVFTHIVQRLREIGARALRREGGCTGDRRGIGGKAEATDRELLRQLFRQRRRVGERALHRGGTRAVVHIANAHAARIIHDDRQHVALRHGRRDHEPRTQQAADHQQHGRGAQGRENGAVSRTQRANARVGDDHDEEYDRCRRRHQHDWHDRCHHQITPCEDARRILEQQRGDGFEPGSHEMVGAGAGVGVLGPPTNRTPWSRRECSVEHDASTP